MATAFTNTPVVCASDANFRAWGSEFSGQMASLGALWTQTTDTGQINWTTVTRPTVASTAAGYEIWQLNDSIGSSAPIFAKIEYGVALTTAEPQMWITVGPSTNGAGTLTGAWSSTRTICCSQVAIASTVTNYPSPMCVLEGCGFAAGFKLGATGSNGGYGFMAVARPCNNDGSVRSDAITVYTQSNAQGVVAHTTNFATNTKIGGQTSGAGLAGSSYCCVPGAAASTNTGTNFQAVSHLNSCPGFYSNNLLATVLGSEIGLNTQDAANLNGAALGFTFNYYCLGSGTVTTGLVGCSANNVINHTLIMAYQ